MPLADGEGIPLEAPVDNGFGTTMGVAVTTGGAEVGTWICPSEIWLWADTATAKATERTMLLMETILRVGIMEVWRFEEMFEGLCEVGLLEGQRN